MGLKMAPAINCIKASFCLKCFQQVVNNLGQASPRARVYKRNRYVRQKTAFFLLVYNHSK